MTAKREPGDYFGVKKLAGQIGAVAGKSGMAG
jgi:hypothetical protein